MKVLYGIQGTGNGHITRSIELLRELNSFVRTDVLVSGWHSEINLPFPIKYKYKGLSYSFGKNGGIDLKSAFKQNNLVRFFKEVRHLPIEEYDLVITDFEPVTAWAARLKSKYSVGVGNQYALQDRRLSKPRSFSPIGRFLLSHYAPVSRRYGIHYYPTVQEFYKPIIRKEVRMLMPFTGKRYLVYLPAESDERIFHWLSRFPDHEFTVFSKHYSGEHSNNRIQFQPVSTKAFLEALESCAGVVCNAGFGLTSEALYLSKKLLVVPMQNQYEQKCNGFYLKNMGATVIKGLTEEWSGDFSEWLTSSYYVNLFYPNNTNRLIRNILEDYVSYEQRSLEVALHDIYGE